jgi:hypothetical protein
MPIALVSSVMPLLLLLSLLFLEGRGLGSRGVFGLAVMAVLIAFVFVKFLREARNMENDDT